MEKVQIAVCPTCGSDKIRLIKQDWRVEFQRQVYLVPDLEFYECPDCGERIYDQQAMREIEVHSSAFVRHRKKAETIIPVPA